MYILEDLWAGRFSPSERAVRAGSLYQKISDENSYWMNAFRKELSPEGKKALEEYYNTQLKLWDISEQDAFIRGVRLGAQFILDVIGEYKSQLPMLLDGGKTE